MIDLSKLNNYSDLIDEKKPVDIDESGVLFAPIEKFFVDKENARTIFNEKKLEELINSINSINPITKKIRGIKQPLSVKKHQTKKGCFIINGGHRRLKAASVIGLKEIPYFIDDEASNTDNVVDNLIRENLTIKDIANFIHMQIEKGKTTLEIANGLGKKQTFVSLYKSYQHFHDYIKNLAENSKCKNIEVLSRLYTTSLDYPLEIKKYCLDKDSNFSRGSVSSFIHKLKNPEEYGNENLKEEKEEDEEDEEDKKSNKRKSDKKDTFKKPIIKIIFQEKIGSLDISSVPEDYGFGFVVFEDGTNQIVKLTSIKITGIEENSN